MAFNLASISFCSSLSSFSLLQILQMGNSCRLWLWMAHFVTCPGTPLNNTNVTVVCPAFFGTIGQGTTNLNGTINITLCNLLNPLGILPLCGAFVQLSLSGTVCPILNTTTGLLTFTMKVVSTVGNAISTVSLGFSLIAP